MREMYLEDPVEGPGFVTREVLEIFSNSDAGLVMIIVRSLGIVRMCE
jgi:hypothetical protein